MRKILILFLFTIIANTLYSSPFTPGNIVVLRIGDGSVTLSSAAAPVFLDEYTTSGTFVQTIALPTSLSGANKRFVNSGSATSEGNLSLSLNGQYITCAGYDTVSGFAGVVAAANVSRVIALIDYSGNVNTSTNLIDGYVTNNIRSSYTVDGTGFWTCGTGTGGGVRYITFGSSSSTQISTTVTNTRFVYVFNNQLYASASSGAFLGVNQVGSGIPITTGQTITNYINTTSGSSSYGFAFNSTGDVCYIADDRSVPNGGIQKWTLSSSVWSLAYTLNTGITKGCRGLTVNFNGANPVLYTTNDSANGNRIYTVTDAGASSPFSIVATSNTNTVFRGIAFAPSAPLPPPPAPPVLISPANNSLGNLTSLSLVWHKSLTATTYRVQLATDAGFSNIITDDSTLTDSVKTISGLQPLTNYWWRVRAKNAGGTSSYSSAYTFRTMGVPAQITGTFIPANGATGQLTTVNFKWPKSSDQVIDNEQTISNYWFELTTDSVSLANLVRDTTLTDTNKTVSSLSYTTNYYWRVKAKNQLGYGSFSFWQRFSTMDPVGILVNGEIPNKYALYNNYPNPFNPSTKISFDIPKQGLTTLKVYDMLGRESAVLINSVLTPGKYEIGFDASGLATGIYFYRLESNGFTQIKKMALIK